MKKSGSPDQAAALPSLRAELAQALRGLQYGQIVILIKDGKVTQIDRTEKKRLPDLRGVGGEGI
jgi:hypothetical protein